MKRTSSISFPTVSLAGMRIGWKCASEHSHISFLSLSTVSMISDSDRGKSPSTARKMSIFFCAAKLIAPPKEP